MYRKTLKYNFSSQNFDGKIAKSTTLAMAVTRLISSSDTHNGILALIFFALAKALINNKREEDLCLKGLQNSRQ